MFNDKNLGFVYYHVRVNFSIDKQMQKPKGKS